jgi:diketogulonate reductase-like aldo/keto reductase
VLRECDKRGIAFVPFSPLGWPRSQHNAILTNSVVTTVACHHGATAAQVVLAWLLALAPNVLLIPGTSSRTHLRENLAAGALSLEQDEIVRLTDQFQRRAEECR